MTERTKTRKELLASALALLMCVAMLIATTFAWFTDTASTSVNKIQAGTLDVKLYYQDPADSDWKDAENKTLGWVQATNADGATTMIENSGLPLWEPGCTFTLPKLKIVNEGNLALKYKIIISGIKGDAELNKVITWTMQLDDEDETLGSEHKLAKKVRDESESSDIFTISGHMDENAGNDYQGLSIDGISITVVATQDTEEFDSEENTYDEYATYPVVAVSQVSVDTATKKTTSSTIIKSVATVSGDDTTPLATATVPIDVLTTSAEGATSTPLKLTIDEAAVPANFTVQVADSSVAKTLEVKMAGLSTENTEPIKVEMYIDSGLDDFVLYHNNNPMTEVESADKVDTDQEYYYDRSSGKITMATVTFSPFTYIYDATIKVTSMEDLSVGSSATWARIVKPGYYKLMNNITISSKILCFNAGGVDINLNNCTLTIDGKQFRTNADVVDATFHDGTIEIKGSGQLWSPSWGTTNLTFKNVAVTSDGKDVFWARNYSSECNLNIIGDNFVITNSRFLWACPDNGSEAKPSKVNVTASGVNVKRTGYRYLEAVWLCTQYNYGEVVASFTNCNFDNSNRDCEPVKISSYKDKSGNNISLTMNNCSLKNKGATELSDYISGYNATNVTMTLNNCTSNNDVALTTGTN